MNKNYEYVAIALAIAINVVVWIAIAPYISKIESGEAKAWIFAMFPITAYGTAKLIEKVYLNFKDKR